MTLAERLVAAQQSSVLLYLRRQELEASRQQIALAIQQVEQGLLKLDGVIETLTAQIAEEA